MNGRGVGVGVSCLLRGTLAVKLPRVLADTMLSIKSSQSLTVFGRNEYCLYWVRAKNGAFSLNGLNQIVC